MPARFRSSTPGAPVTAGPQDRWTREIGWFVSAAAGVLIEDAGYRREVPLPTRHAASRPALIPRQSSSGWSGGTTAWRPGVWCPRTAVQAAD